MTDYTKPAIAPVWGELNTTPADMVRPSDAEIQAGWPLSSVPPSRQRFNWLINYAFQGVKYLFQRGIADWTADETYRTGSRIIGDDGKTYVSIQNANINHSPSSSPLWWTVWGSTIAEAATAIFGTDSGAANAIVVATTPAIPANTNGLTVRFIANTTGTGASTINVGAGVKDLRSNTGAALQAGDIVAGTMYTATYSTVLGFYMLTGTVLSQLSAIIPSGHTDYFATNFAPAGYLKANGTNVSRTTYAALFAALVTNAGFTSQNFTVTIAAPGVFTKTAHGFLGGERLRLSTTGALPTGLNTTSDFFVIFVDANTFRLASSQDNQQTGTAITTTGTQSGTHSYLQSLWGLGDGTTTFTLPDLRAEVIRGYDDGRGVDISRVMATRQNDAAQLHGHKSIQNTGKPYTAGGVQGDYLAVAPVDGPFNTGSVLEQVLVTGGTTPRVANETRARNVALLACVKI